MAKIEIVHLILLNFPDDETGFRIFIRVWFSDWGNSLHLHYITQKNAMLNHELKKLRKRTFMTLCHRFSGNVIPCNRENENA